MEKQNNTVEAVSLDINNTRENLKKLENNNTKEDLKELKNQVEKVNNFENKELIKEKIKFCNKSLNSIKKLIKEGPPVIHKDTYMQLIYGGITTLQNALKDIKETTIKLSKKEVEGIIKLELEMYEILNQ